MSQFHWTCQVPKDRGDDAVDPRWALIGDPGEKTACKLQLSANRRQPANACMAAWQLGVSVFHHSGCGVLTSAAQPASVLVSNSDR